MRDGISFFRRHRVRRYPAAPYHIPVADDVTRMFARIAPRYDLANDVLSLGLAPGLAARLVARSGASPGERALDCATGTGDLALLLKRLVGPDGRVTGIDACRRCWSWRAGRPPGATENDFHLADMLRCPSGWPFDAATWPSACATWTSLKSAWRRWRASSPRRARAGAGVRPARGRLRRAFSWYSRRLIPPLGGLLTGDRQAYEYLHRTSAAFPCGEAFLRMMREAGCFAEAEGLALTGGIAYLYVGVAGRHAGLD